MKKIKKVIIKSTHYLAKLSDGLWLGKAMMTNLKNKAKNNFFILNHLPCIKVNNNLGKYYFVLFVLNDKTII